MGVVHKSERGGGALCQPVRGGVGHPSRIPDNTTATSIYWDGVTCQGCLALKPMDVGRTSFKHSHRAEGDNTLD